MSYGVSEMDNPTSSMTDKQGAEELQEFLYMEQQKAQLRSQVRKKLKYFN
jgi:hypothetical protein